MFSLVMMLAQRGINYNPCNEKVVVCRDIEFDVEGTWDWSFQEEKRQSNIFIEEEKPSNEEFCKHLHQLHPHLHSLHNQVQGQQK